jgi:hypothetical protein
MPSAPSKPVEALVTILLPSACREEVLGDLRELYRSPGQYAFLALRTVPLVMLSRIRRTSDPALLLLQALVLYLAFVGAAWPLPDPAELPQLAIPAVIALTGVILEDAYARPGQRSGAKLVRGPAVGIVLALALSRMVPLWVLLDGCAMGLLLSSAVRLLFPPGTGKFAG